MNKKLLSIGDKTPFGEVVGYGKDYYSVYRKGKISKILKKLL